MNGRDFLEKVLGQPGDKELADLIQSLVSTRVPEDTWLDYKDGVWTQDVDTKELRKDVTAFGNGDGGCLVVGVAEAHKRPTGFSTCTGDLNRAIQQVAGVLQSVAGLLFPPPREARHIKLPAGEDVLVIAIPRSGRMAHVMESGLSRYYLRIADGTQAVPDYLLADLFFGRRHQPALALRPATGSTVETDKDGRSVTIRLTLENRGPTYAQGLYGGAVFASLPSGSHDALNGEHLLIEKVSWNLTSPDLRRGHREFDFFSPSKPEKHLSLVPFATRDLAFGAKLPVEPAGSIEWYSVVYVGTSDGPAQWWEVRSTISPTADRVVPTVREIWDRLPEVTYRRAPP